MAGHAMDQFLKKSYHVKFTRFIHDDIEIINDEFGDIKKRLFRVSICDSLLYLLQFNEELQVGICDFAVNFENDSTIETVRIEKVNLKNVTWNDDEVVIHSEIELTSELGCQDFIDEIQKSFYDGFAGMQGNFQIQP